MKISHLATLVFPALLLLGFASCSSTSARVKRIETNPEIYAGLSQEERALVEAGEIREGFSKEAVFLAWGRPNDIRRGSREGRQYETWIYSAAEPAWDPYWSLGYGYGHGYYGPYGHGQYYHRPYVGFYPAFHRTRRVYLGRVEFVQDHVTSWEIGR